MGHILPVSVDSKYGPVIFRFLCNLPNRIYIQNQENMQSV
jgi:hypothetical protein